MLESHLLNNPQEAQALNPICTPLDPLVVRWPFGRKFTKHWNGLVCAQVRLLNAVYDYDRALQKQKACVRKRRTVGNGLDDIANAIRSSETFAGECCDANQPDQDRHEQDVLARFLNERAVPFAEFWKQAVEALGHGISLEIKPADIPIWFDERLE